MAPVDPQAQALLDRWAAAPATPVERLTPAAVRRDDLAVLDLQARAAPLYAVEDIELPGPAGSLPARVYRPRPGRLPVVLYLHGGGFVIGPEGYDAPIRSLALAAGCEIVAPHYRLAPEHPYPAALQDALAAARSLADGPIGIVGDSSGGNLAAVLANTLTREGVEVVFQALIYPMVDATAGAASYDEFATGYGFTREKSLWYFDQYLPPGADRCDARISPLFEPDLSGLPPTLIATAECDPLRDEGETYAAKLRKAGIQVELHRYPGMIHGFFQMTGALDGAKRLHEDLAGWLKAKAGSSRPSGSPT